MTERSVQYAGWRRQSPSSSSGPSLHKCRCGEEPTRRSSLRGNNLHVSALTFQIRHHRSGRRSSTSPRKYGGFQVCIRRLKSHAARKRRKNEMISEAAVKFTSSLVSLEERRQLGKNPSTVTIKRMN